MSREPPSPWPMLVIVGILCGVALGAVAALLRGQRLLPGRTRDELDDFEPIYLPPAPTPKLPVASTSKPIARTVRISRTTPTMLLKANGVKDWDVWVRVVSPPGAFAMVSIGISSDQVTIPAGGQHRMRVPCGDFLFAQGNVNGVEVSVSGGEC